MWVFFGLLMLGICIDHGLVAIAKVLQQEFARRRPIEGGR